MTDDEDPIIKALRAELAPIRAELAALCNPPPRSTRDLFRGHGVGAVTIGEVEALHHDVDKLQRWQLTVDARLAAIERLMEELRR
jgi:hypothetical protein